MFIFLLNAFWYLRLLLLWIKSQPSVHINVLHMKNHVTLFCSLLNMKKWLYLMSLFLCLSCISLGLSCQKILPKVQAPKRCKQGRYLNLYSFSNRNAITKIRLPSHNFAINTNNCYNLQEDMKICKNCEKKEIEGEIHITFSCNRYDKIQRKAFYDINELDNIKLQIRNKIEN